MNNVEQKLVDLCFQIALTISDTGKDRNGDPITLYKLSTEERAKWIARQLELCGIHTRPVGSSWGVITRID